VVVKVLEQENCPQCGHLLAVKNGRYGMFIGCTNYPECHFVVHEQPQTAVAITCPSCKSGTLVERINKFGKAFFACDAYPKCKFLLNDKPVAGQCSGCGYPLLTEKKTVRGIKHYCASKKCQQEQPD
jgi:putative DNA topoisomerase